MREERFPIISLISLIIAGCIFLFTPFYLFNVGGIGDKVNNLGADSKPIVVQVQSTQSFNSNNSDGVTEIDAH